MMAVTADPGTTVAISRVTDEMECNVCTKGGSNPTCSPTELTLTNPQNTSLEFSCPQPQDVFSVQVKRKIGERADLEVIPDQRVKMCIYFI